MNTDYRVKRHPDGRRWIVVDGDDTRYGIIETFETRDAARVFTGRKPGRGPGTVVPGEPRKVSVLEAEKRNARHHITSADTSGR